jgi:hypothetical protein
VALKEGEAIPLLGINQKECDLGYYKGTCTPMFIAALFMIAKLGKQPLLTNGLRKGSTQPQRRMKNFVILK